MGWTINRNKSAVAMASTVVGFVNRAARSARASANRARPRGLSGRQRGAVALVAGRASASGLPISPQGRTTSTPAITFTAIDDRGQEQPSITFLGTFQRCDEVSAPKALVSGKSYSTCMTYLIPGGGSIQSVKWDSGPNTANDVSPYFDKPIVWGA